MKLLIDHINDKHGGNKAAFARSYGISKQNLNKKLKNKKRIYIYKGEMYAKL